MMYMSPERFEAGHKSSTKSDVWSFGIIVLELISYPHVISNHHVLTNMRQTSSLLNAKQWNEELKSDVTLFEMLSKMLHVDEKQRFEMHHVFLNKALANDQSIDISRDGIED